LLKVIGAGFARTGTTTVMAALEQLGFGPCYHMNTIFAHPEHLAFWQAAIDGQPVDWDGMFATYQSSLDWPASAFYAELLRVYPDAKVLLTVRDPERWYESVLKTIYEAYQRKMSPVADGESYYHMIETLIYERIFDGKFADRRYALDVFERHIQEVTERVPREKLLVYDVKEGWEPLCRFLGVEEPAGQPFPHLNDTNAFRQWVRLPDAGSVVAQRG
jgi:hypothetical protein